MHTKCLENLKYHICVSLRHLARLKNSCIVNEQNTASNIKMTYWLKTPSKDATLISHVILCHVIIYLLPIVLLSSWGGVNS